MHDPLQGLREEAQTVGRDLMLSLLEELVRRESPSHDKRALDLLGTYLADRLRAIGGSVEVIANAEGGDHVLARFPGPAGRRPALVLGHFDTVWPKGALERLPFRAQDDQVFGRAFGPGVFDMKAGLTLFWGAMLRLKGSPRPVPRPIWVLFTSDEEIGSPTSRNLIEETARQCAYVLVLEPPLADGSLKTSRKGVGRFRLEVEGRAAHSGVAPQDGRSAIVELAHQVLRLQGLQDLAAGTTLNVGVIRGGTTANVVPAQASAEIDVRAAARAEADRITRSLQALSPVTPDVRLAITGQFTRPPMERTPAIAALFDQARRIGRSLGLELTEGATGGGSDGNFTAALDIPTLDGLGARGGGAHADDEHILIDSLPERAALLAALLLELQVEP
jgi:glutamate carboxypeptidase